MLHPYGIQTAIGLQAYHRQMAGGQPPDSQESAWIWTFRGRKLDLFLVPESGNKIGPGRGHFSKDYYKGAGNWTRYWCRNLAPKLVPDSGRAGSFLGRGRGRNPAPPLVPDSAPDPTQKRPRQSFSCISATGVPSRRRSLP